MRDRVYYPDDLLELYSPRASPASREEARQALKSDAAGLNCRQLHYHVLDSQAAKYPAFFARIDRHLADPNIAYEPLGYRESRGFGWEPYRPQLPFPSIRPAVRSE